jgi:hypothetical protein
VEINSPEAMMNAIKLLILQMNREQRKKFLMWVKAKRNEFDFSYPQGYKLEEKEIVNEPAKEVSADVVLTVPDTRLVDSQGQTLPPTEGV